MTSFPHEYLAPYDPPEAKGLMDGARAPDQRWYGAYANYNAPAYNSKFVKQADLPKSYDEFPAHKEWAGKIAIDDTDAEWVAAMFCLLRRGAWRERSSKTSPPRSTRSLTDGHLALARSVAPANTGWRSTTSSTLTHERENVGCADGLLAAQSGDAVFGAVGINVLAPHPNAAKLAENFVLSHEAQKLITTKGRFRRGPRCRPIRPRSANSSNR